MWEWPDALELCAGSENHMLTVGCFELHQRRGDLKLTPSTLASGNSLFALILFALMQSGAISRKPSMARRGRMYAFGEKRSLVSRSGLTAHCH